MSSESPPAKPPKPRPAAKPAGTGARVGPPASFLLLDGVLLIGFLGLTFLLGAFPLKDTDFWWHLRTGDLIRRTGVVPSTDMYTYTVAGRPWVDLHWVFQVAISWGYGLGGVPALTLAKCVVTTAAVALLVTARRRDWPLWALLPAWLPALLVLGGRMYVRPETLSLLYLSIFLAVLTRLDRAPRLAFALPFVQTAWVNTQGLFVLGPVLWAFALLDAASRPGAFARGRTTFWRTALSAAALTGVACVLNPYGLTGALYPLELARTMANPVFSNSIAELTPIPLFIRRDGFVSLPLRLHVATMILGAISFILPVLWTVWTRFTGPDPAPPEKAAGGRKTPKRAAAKSAPPVAPDGWRLSPFRLLLFAAFSVLSWQATRNSHQFAAVVGAVTAWNFAEWAAAVARRSKAGGGLGPRVAALTAVAGVFLWVATGSYYAAAREGRTVGLGEQPLWFPHDAVKFAGGPGMPPRFLGFHIGHPSLYEYYFGPDRKVFADARLEVIGPDLFERYTDLQRRISGDADGWSRELDAAERPVVLADHEGNAGVTATMLGSPDWRCVWFDPVAAVFVHAAYDDVVRAHQVDFAARHFRPEPAFEPHGTAALLASAKGLRNVASLAARAGPDRTRGLVLLGLDHARRLVRADPTGADGWRMVGQLEMIREAPPKEPVPRFRMPFDPVFDLTPVRSTYALSQAASAAPDDFTLLLLLERVYESRAMTEAALPLADRIVGLTPINAIQRQNQAQLDAARASMRAELGPAPPANWDNLSQLGQIVGGLLGAGRAATAADYLERAAPPNSRSWEETDRIATLRLHLGEPRRARDLWVNAPAPPRPAVRSARVAVSYLVEGAFEEARQAYQDALAAEPELFEALYGLAVLEQDAGRAGESLKAARKAVSAATTEVGRSTAQGIVSFVTPYAVSGVAKAPGD